MPSLRILSSWPLSWKYFTKGRINKTKILKVKIYSEKGWIYKDKDETINDLVNGKYLILDNHYQNVVDNFDLENNETFEKFKTYYNCGDKTLVEKLKKDCELLLFNNR